MTQHDTVQDLSIETIKRNNKNAGRFWFSPDTLRFFSSVVYDDVYSGPGGHFFVTSEVPPYEKRQYSVREYDPQSHQINTHGEFCGHHSLSSARKAAKEASLGR